MKIVITGANGLIGRNLRSKLLTGGNTLTLLTRDASLINKDQNPSCVVKSWDYTNVDQLRELIDNNDAIIHLAGANLSSKRWSKKYKNIIYDSRITSTKNIVTAINLCRVKPKVFIMLSAVGIYGDRGDELLYEESEYGNDFLANLCEDWENEARKVESLGLRRISLRVGLVLSTESGVLKKLLLPFKLFVGGTLGNGNQWFPWIHIQDVVNIIDFTLQNDQINGAINCAAPGIVRMKDFAKTLGKTLRRPSYIRIPRFALRIISGQIAETAISGQRASVEKLIKAGYQFKFKDLEGALTNLLIS